MPLATVIISGDPDRLDHPNLKAAISMVLNATYLSHMDLAACTPEQLEVMSLRQPVAWLESPVSPDLVFIDVPSLYHSMEL
jgi:hypothetical protein